MRRYLRQRDHYSCGPVALINYHKWLGLPATGRQLKRYQRICKCRRPNGTHPHGFSTAVGKTHHFVSYQNFKKYLQCGGCAIINAKVPSGRHYFFVAGIAQRSDGKISFLAVNYCVDETLTLISWAEMRSILRRSFVWTFNIH
jgi:hypothetical protein